MHAFIFESAQTFLLNNARLLERRLFSHLFLGGIAQAVHHVLRAYQNPDCGFGNALEPDKRTLSSQPIDQEFALRVLDDAGFEPDIAKDICTYLQSITTPEGGVPFVLPTVRDAPRTSWWNCKDNPPASINPTASIVGLLHKHGFQHPWLERATEYCWQTIETGGDLDANDALCVALFLEHVPDRSRAQTVLNRFTVQLLTEEIVALDPYAQGYVHKVLEWAPRPDSLYHSLFDDQTIQAHLQALIEQQQEDGGWPISWSTISPGAEMEYRGVVTLHALKTLRAYGKI